MFLSAISIFVCVISFSCGTGPTLPGPVTFTLAPGESASSADVRVTFIRVVSDSRCPLGVACVTAGDAIIEVAFTVGRDARKSEMALNEASIRTLVFNGVSFEFQDLSPYPVAGRQTDPGAYRARIMAVSR